MKPYLINVMFAPILTVAHFAFPQDYFMLFIVLVVIINGAHMFTYEKPKYEWPKLTFSQDTQTLTITMTTENGKKMDRFLSFDRLNLPKVEKIVEKTQSSIWHVLGMMPTTNSDAVEKAFRKMSMVYHPDQGGTSGSFNTLVEAKAKALKVCNNS